MTVLIACGWRCGQIADQVFGPVAPLGLFFGPRAESSVSFLGGRQDVRLRIHQKQSPMRMRPRKAKTAVS